MCPVAVEARQQPGRLPPPAQHIAGVVKPSSLCFSNEELCRWARPSAFICLVKRACNVAFHGNHSGLLSKHGARAQTGSMVVALATTQQQRPQREDQLLEAPKQRGVSGDQQATLLSPAALRAPISLQSNFGEGEFVDGFYFNLKRCDTTGVV